MIGKYLTLEQCCKSAEAIRFNIPNMPDNDCIGNMHKLAINVYDKLCDHYNFRIPITSFFRSKELNTKIKGAKNSDHVKGCAIDLDMDGSGQSITNNTLFHYVKDNLEFKQLIWEFGDDKNPSWVHVSYKEGANNKTVLVAKKENGKTVYLPYR